MNPLTGRFWTADSYEGNREDPASLHKFLYCDQEPINYHDPSGRSRLGELMTVAGISAIASMITTAVTARDLAKTDMQAYLGEIGMSGLIGFISGFVGGVGGKVFFKTVGPLLKGALEGATSAFVSQVLTEFYSFVIGRQPLTFTAVMGSVERVVIATFAGGFFGGLTARLQVFKSQSYNMARPHIDSTLAPMPLTYLTTERALFQWAPTSGMIGGGIVVNWLASNEWVRNLIFETEQPAIAQ